MAVQSLGSVTTRGGVLVHVPWVARGVGVWRVARGVGMWRGEGTVPTRYGDT